MAGTYKVTQILSHPTKFECMVEFNGKPAEVYQVDSLEQEEINRQLQQTADDDQVRLDSIAAVAAVIEGASIVDGKVVL
jgi:hypothetical protein